MFVPIETLYTCGARVPPTVDAGIQGFAAMVKSHAAAGTAVVVPMEDPLIGRGKVCSGSKEEDNSALSTILLYNSI